MALTKKKANGIPTIDVVLVVIRTGSESSGVEYAIDTSNKISVEPQTETADAIKLVKLGRVLAQKPQQTTITGHQITLTDSVFTPVLAKILQGGALGTAGADGYQSYTPPVSGSNDKGEIFVLDCYSAVYDSSGQIVKYEKISYPNCQGTPFTVNKEDDVFTVSEYTINSAPKSGEAPFSISYVDELPDFSSAMVNTLSDETGLSEY